MHGDRRQDRGLSRTNLFDLCFSAVAYRQQILRRWPALFQVQGRVAERHPASAGRLRDNRWITHGNYYYDQAKNIIE